MRVIVMAAVVALALLGCGMDPLPSDDARIACGPGARLLQVPQGAMDPTLKSGDVAAIIPLEASGPKRGDIVVIDWRAWTGDAFTDVPMRIVDEPDYHIELRAGKVVVDGSALAEPYLEAGVTTEPMPDGPTDWTVTEGSVFVLGDGRLNAADSRLYGLVPSGALRGRVAFRCGPEGRTGPVS